MNFSKLRHRIIFLRPTDMIKNSMGETVPRYKPFKPYLPLPIQVDADKVYLSHDNDGNAVLKYIDGKPYAHKLALQNFSVAGLVAPMSGREYEEKIARTIKSCFSATALKHLVSVCIQKPVNSVRHLFTGTVFIEM